MFKWYARFQFISVERTEMWCWCWCMQSIFAAILIHLYVWVWVRGCVWAMTKVTLARYASVYAFVSKYHIVRMYATRACLSRWCINVCVCVGIIRARYGVLLESQCQCQWSCEQTKSNQNNIHFLYGENKKILPWLKDGERVYTMYTTHTPSVYKWKSTTTTTNSKHPNQHFDISTESNKSIRGQWKKEHKT